MHQMPKQLYILCRVEVVVVKLLVIWHKPPRNGGNSKTFVGKESTPKLGGFMIQFGVRIFFSNGLLQPATSTLFPTVMEVAKWTPLGDWTHLPLGPMKSFPWLSWLWEESVSVSSIWDVFLSGFHFPKNQTEHLPGSGFGWNFLMLVLGFVFSVRVEAYDSQLDYPLVNWHSNGTSPFSIHLYSGSIVHC